MKKSIILINRSYTCPDPLKKLMSPCKRNGKIRVNSNIMTKTIQKMIHVLAFLFNLARNQKFSIKKTKPWLILTRQGERLSLFYQSNLVFRDTAKLYLGNGF